MSNPDRELRLVLARMKLKLRDAAADGVPGAEERLAMVRRFEQDYRMSMEFLESLPTDEDGRLSEDDLALLDVFDEFATRERENDSE